MNQFINKFNLINNTFLIQLKTKDTKKKGLVWLVNQNYFLKMWAENGVMLAKEEITEKLNAMR